MDSKQRELNKQILDRIASDPKFREALLDDPRGAMERAGFKWDAGSEDEVSGYGLLFTTALNCPMPKGGEPGPITTALNCSPQPGIDPAYYYGGGGGVASTAITCPEPKPAGDPGTGTVPPAGTVPPPTTT